MNTQLTSPRKLTRTMLLCSGLALLCGFSTITNAQALDPKDRAPANPAMISPSAQGQGRLVFASKTQDTGEILDTGLATLEYIFRNTGAGPLTITQVKPACGCTVPELAKKTYMPGEQGTITVTFDPRGKRGGIARSITVFTDSDLSPSESIVVRALVKPVIITEPLILPFEPTTKGEGAVNDFKIYGRIEGFKVTRATIDDTDAFSLEIIDGGEVDKDGEKLTLQIIRVTLKKDAKPNNHRAQLTVRTNDERRSILPLTTVARVLGDLNTDPIRVTMGRLVVGDEFVREFTITTKSGDPFEIKSANANTIALDATYEFTPVDPEIRNQWIVKVTGTVTNAAPRFNTQIYIVTDVQDEEQLTMQMYGQLLAQ